jgi:hypothetical protein
MLCFLLVGRRKKKKKKEVAMDLLPRVRGWAHPAGCVSQAFHSCQEQLKIDLGGIQDGN